VLVIDSQLHLWSPERPDEWPPGHHLLLDADAAIHQMDVAQVDRAVLVPTLFQLDRNDVCLEAARRYPSRFAVMGRIKIDDPASPAMMANWTEQPGMLGLRLTFHQPWSGPWLTDGTADWLWEKAEAAGVPVMLYAPGRELELGRIAARHPALRLAIDHMNLAGPQATQYASPGDRVSVSTAIDRLLPLSDYGNVSVKASALQGHTSQAYPFSDLHDPVRRVIECFGADRVFWGTDLTRLKCTYTEAKTFFTRELPFLTEDQKRLIMGEAISKWLPWYGNP
jgi:L-fuconolactonase